MRGSHQATEGPQIAPFQGRGGEQHSLAFFDDMARAPKETIGQDRSGSVEIATGQVPQFLQIEAVRLQLLDRQGALLSPTVVFRSGETATHSAVDDEDRQSIRHPHQLLG